MSNKILIVEDELIVALDLQMILGNAGYEICGIAASFDEAMSIVAKKAPDLVLIDIHLKGKGTGIHLARELQKINMPFVYLSANTNQKVIDAAIITKPYGFLVKPFREKDLLLALEVARFRHRDLQQFPLQKEARLRKRLEAIRNEAGDRNAKLTKVVQELEVFIPFDFVMVISHERNAATGGIWSCRKISYEDYELFDEGDLLQAGYILPDDLAFPLEPLAADQEIDYHPTAAVSVPVQALPVQQILAEKFGLQSHLSIGFEFANQYLLLVFYHREAEVFQEAHVHLIRRVFASLKGTLFAVVREAKNEEQGSGSDLHADNKPPGYEGIIGNSPKMVDVFDQIRQISPFDTTVLITGDTGTGKERVAQVIHKLSGRAQELFVVINCSALADPLIEFELFGYEKETFDGKTEFQVGRFEAADGGTVFLDEIAQMPLALQAKLLQIIQKKQVLRIGGREPRKVNLRFIFSTNHALEKEIANGRFRLDLYFRLTAFPIQLPRLHERKGDVKFLAKYFCQILSVTLNKPFLGLSESMVQELMNYHWPGNVRELKNVMEHSMILSDGQTLLEIRRKLENSDDPI